MQQLARAVLNFKQAVLQQSAGKTTARAVSQMLGGLDILIAHSIRELTAMRRAAKLSPSTVERWRLITAI